MSLDKALFQKVANRGKPPEAFLNELIAWANQASDSVFSPNKRIDIYSLTAAELGPWQSLVHRKAAMCEVLRVLAGFESSWRWSEGKDTNNPAENSTETESAGIFQVSPNSRFLDDSLMSFARANRADKPEQFRKTMMTNHNFAFDYTARLLRVNLRHNGPVKRGEILPWLKRDAVAAFESQLEGAMV